MTQQTLDEIFANEVRRRRAEYQKIRQNSNLFPPKGRPILDVKIEQGRNPRSRTGLMCSSNVCRRRLVVRKLCTLSASRADDNLNRTRSVFWSTSLLGSDAIDIKGPNLVAGKRQYRAHSEKRDLADASDSRIYG